MQYLIGQAHSELLCWLSKTWLRDGPPVCFVEGFPGVGKSSLARSLMQVVQAQPDWASVMVAMPEGETDPVNDLLLDLGSELSWAGHDKIADAVSEGKSLEHALAVVLRRPILIIVDEFQRAFLQDSGQPIKPLEQIFQKLANRPNIPGRMLLLTNRLVEQGQWSEPYVTRRLTALAAAEAEQLLGQLLREKNLDEEVSGERRRDVVHWLGCNPRAIRVLVENLERESLDDLIGINPQSWELRDREVSEGLVYDLEKKLLERTLSHLSTETTTFLKWISVYRKPPKRQAMEMVISKNKKDKKVFDTRFEELRNRFLIERQDRWYNLHPVAREIALQRLKENAVELREAHSKAADFYIRPFQAQEIKGGKLGGSFVEARYHLVQARREVELGQISHNFKNHLQATIYNRSIPTQSDELDESIAVFSVLVESTASEESERYLAQLLQTRGNDGDLQQALLHTRRATDLGFQVESWLLRADLEQQINDSEAALATCMEGISRVSANEDVYQLYNYCTKLLIQLGRPNEAINLLEAGISQVVPEQGLSSLYQLGTELLTQVGQIERAISWLKVGIDRMLPGQRLASLYQHCANLLFQSNQLNEAINLLQEGIERISPEQGLVSLYQCYGEVLSQSNQVDKAIAVLKEGIHSIPPKYNPFSLYQSCAELLVQSGEVYKAIELLKRSLQNLPLEQSLIELYERWGNLLAKLGQTNGAIALLKEGICNIPPARGPVALYQRCGELLVESGQVNEAINLLELGIRKIPAERSHTILYERCGALLVQSGQSDKAIALFLDGIRAIRNQKAQFILYKCCAEVLEKSGQGNEAVALLKEGIRSIPNDDTRRILYLDCAALLKRIDQLDAAIELLQQGINRIPPDKTLVTLYDQCSNLLGQANRIDEAIELLRQGINRIPPDKNLFTLYDRCSNLLGQANRIDEAIELLRQGINHIPPDHNLVTLYDRCSNLLGQANRIDEAIELLRQGINCIPLDTGHPHLLYNRCSNLLGQANRIDEAIELLRQGINRIPPDKTLFTLYNRCSNLLGQTNRTEEAIELLKQGINRIPLDKNIVPLYVHCSTLLAQTNRTEEAIELLKQGINRIPPDKGLVSLYDRCSNLLAQAKANRIEEAIELLQQGINRIPPDKDSRVLYQTGAKIFAKTNRVREAIKFLKEGIQNIPIGQGARYRLIETAMLLCVASQNKSELETTLAGTSKHSLSPQTIILGKVLLAQMQQNWQQAAEIAEQGVIEFPVYLTLISEAAFSWFCIGNTDKAKQTLQTSASQLKQGSPTLWLKAWIELKHGDRQLAMESLSAYLGHPIQELEELNETFLLALWDNSIDAEEENNLAFYFPTLPLSLTGLDAPVTRLQFSPPILSGIVKTMSGAIRCSVNRGNQPAHSATNHLNKGG